MLDVNLAVKKGTTGYVLDERVTSLQTLSRIFGNNLKHDVGGFQSRILVLAGNKTLFIINHHTRCEQVPKGRIGLKNHAGFSQLGFRVLWRDRNAKLLGFACQSRRSCGVRRSRALPASSFALMNPSTP